MAFSVYKILNNQNIFDIVIATVSDLNSTYSLLLINPEITSISEIPIGLEVNYTSPTPTPPIVFSPTPQQRTTRQEYRSRNNQSVFDVCLMTSVDLNSAYQLMIDSNFYNLQERPSPNTLFIFNPQKVLDNIFKDYLKRSGLVITTGSSIDKNYLLQDDKFYLLQDDGFRIII